MENDSLKIAVRGMAPYFSVFDMPASLKFYRDILGFEVVESSGVDDEADWVMLKLNDVTLMLNTAFEKLKRPAEVDTARNAAHGDVTLYFGCPKVDDVYTYLINKGIELAKPHITMYGWKAINVTDPDGYCLCFHWPLQEG